MKLLFDTSAWLAIFFNQDTGKAEQLLQKNPGEILTTAANLYEIYYKAAGKNGTDKAVISVSSVKNYSKILDVTEEIALEAAKLRLSHGVKAIDAFTLAASRLNNAKLVTADHDFDAFKNETVFLD